MHAPFSQSIQLTLRHDFPFLAVTAPFKADASVPSVLEEDQIDVILLSADQFDSSSVLSCAVRGPVVDKEVRVDVEADAIIRTIETK